MYDLHHDRTGEVVDYLAATWCLYESLNDEKVYAAPQFMLIGMSQIKADVFDGRISVTAPKRLTVLSGDGRHFTNHHHVDASLVLYVYDLIPL